MILETALLCMALNIYHESRSEEIKGQYAVALVTWNRAGQNQRRVCAQVNKPYQFSWTTNLMEKVGTGYRLKPAGIPKEQEAWDKAVKVAKKVLSNRVADFTGGSTHYHTTAVSPRWKHSFKVALQLGNHIFYVDS